MTPLHLDGMTWRKSSYSHYSGECVEVATNVPAMWRKSSHSSIHGDCVEVAPNPPGVVAIRDSKTPGAPVLVVPGDSFASFVRPLKRR